MTKLRDELAERMTDTELGREIVSLERLQGHGIRLAAEQEKLLNAYRGELATRMMVSEASKRVELPDGSRMMASGGDAEKFILNTLNTGNTIVDMAKAGSDAAQKAIDDVGTILGKRLKTHQEMQDWASILRDCKEHGQGMDIRNPSVMIQTYKDATGRDLTLTVWEKATIAAAQKAFEEYIKSKNPLSN
ncbi:hypothetical protein HY792_03505 [Candidatus Desantisbacteria bacterium]|nr:hypothetical protein [Candidatus Desantisbacteria bacterium]